MIVRSHDIGNAVAVQVANRQAGIGPADAVSHLRFECAIAVPEENANILVAVISDNNILLAVEVQISGGDEFDLVASAVGFLRLESAIPVAEQDADRIVIV